MRYFSGLFVRPIAAWRFIFERLRGFSIRAGGGGEIEGLLDASWAALSSFFAAASWAEYKNKISKGLAHRRHKVSRARGVAGTRYCRLDTSWLVGSSRRRLTVTGCSRHNRRTRNTYHAESQLRCLVLQSQLGHLAQGLDGPRQQLM